MVRDVFCQDRKKVFIVFTMYSLLHECIFITAAVKNNVINIFSLRVSLRLLDIYIQMYGCIY